MTTNPVDCGFPVENLYVRVPVDLEALQYNGAIDAAVHCAAEAVRDALEKRRQELYGDD